MDVGKRQLQVHLLLTLYFRIREVKENKPVKKLDCKHRSEQKSYFI